jgi:hypothetical protein
MRSAGSGAPIARERLLEPLAARLRDGDAKARGSRALALAAGGPREAEAPAVAPHSRRNFAAGGSSVPQLAQRAASAAPHSRQNLPRSGFACWQAVQFIEAPHAAKP